MHVEMKWLLCTQPPACTETSSDTDDQLPDVPSSICLPRSNPHAEYIEILGSSEESLEEEPATGDKDRSTSPPQPDFTCVYIVVVCLRALSLSFSLSLSLSSLAPPLLPPLSRPPLSHPPLLSLSLSHTHTHTYARKHTFSIAFGLGTNRLLSSA